MARNEAVILPVNCVSAHKTYYARYDYAYDGVWVLSYGLKEVPSDGVGSSVSGIAKIDISNSRTGPQYKCPYCGNRMFVRLRQMPQADMLFWKRTVYMRSLWECGEVTGTSDALVVPQAF